MQTNDVEDFIRAWKLAYNVREKSKGTKQAYWAGKASALAWVIQRLTGNNPELAGDCEDFLAWDDVDKKVNKPKV